MRGRYYDRDHGNITSHDPTPTDRRPLVFKGGQARTPSPPMATRFERSLESAHSTDKPLPAADAPPSHVAPQQLRETEARGATAFEALPLQTFVRPPDQQGPTAAPFASVHTATALQPSAPPLSVSDPMVLRQLQEHDQAQRQILTETLRLQTDAQEAFKDHEDKLRQEAAVRR